MNLKTLIIFDMDGVIIDVSKSYREAARQTTRLFFKPTRLFEKLPDPLFSLEELAAVKQSGGLNNDWDLTCFVLELLFSLVDPPEKRDTKTDWQTYRNALSLCDINRLVQYLKYTDRPLTALMDSRQKVSDPFIRSFFINDVGNGNIIKQIFQEIYLGKDLFSETYGMPPKAYDRDGYIERETLLADKALFEALSKKAVLAVATGRPRSEAFYPLDLFGLKSFFDFVLTLNDCIQEEKRLFQEIGKTMSLSKPHPFMLDAIAERVVNLDRCYYVGDMPDDMIAAVRATHAFTGIGALSSAPDKEKLQKELLKAGGKHIIKDLTELPSIIFP